MSAVLQTGPSLQAVAFQHTKPVGEVKSLSDIAELL